MMVVSLSLRPPICLFFLVVIFNFSITSNTFRVDVLYYISVTYSGIFLHCHPCNKHTYIGTDRCSPLSLIHISAAIE